MAALWNRSESPREPLSIAAARSVLRVLCGHVKKPSLRPEVNLVEDADPQAVRMSCFPACSTLAVRNEQRTHEKRGGKKSSSPMIDFFAFSQDWGLHLKQSIRSYGQLQISRVREKNKTIRGRDRYNSTKRVSGVRDQILSFCIERGSMLYCKAL